MAANPKPDTRDRSVIAERFTWDLSHIYPGWETWEQDLKRIDGLLERYVALRGTLATGADRILEACRLSDELGQIAYRLYRYPGLMQSQDTRDNAVQARLDRVKHVFAKFAQATSWYTPELLTIPRETMESWLDSTPALAPWRFPILETYRQAEHVLDEDGEHLLALASRFNGTPSETYSMLANADVQYPEIELSDGRRITASHGEYMQGLRRLRLQEDREKLFRAHYTVYDDRPNTWASIYHAVLQRDWFLAQARRHPSTLGAALDGNAIPTMVVEGLIASAMDGAEPLRRYHRLRRRALGLETYRYLDAYLPLVDVDWPFYYDQVQQLLVSSVAVFGADYQATVQRSFADRWIDVYENQGKRSGAFSAGVYGVHPYMLLNYSDTLNDAFTVAHEMGHTMHTVLSHESQPFATAEYTIFVAEVASMTNEDLFLDTLLAETADPQRRAVLLQHAIDDVCAGFYRQAMFARYELEAHRAVESGQPITAETLQRIYLESMAAFFGSSLDDHDWERNTWARVPHFYNSPFYVYQYATSKCAASLIHERMTTGDEGSRQETVRDYLQLLRSGGNDHPVAQLAAAGVDFATPAPYEALVTKVSGLVDELETTLEDLGRL